MIHEVHNRPVWIFGKSLFRYLGRPLSGTLRDRFCVNTKDSSYLIFFSLLKYPEPLSPSSLSAGSLAWEFTEKMELIKR